MTETQFISALESSPFGRHVIRDAAVFSDGDSMSSGPAVIPQDLSPGSMSDRCKAIHAITQAAPHHDLVPDGITSGIYHQFHGLLAPQAILLARHMGHRVSSKKEAITTLVKKARAHKRSNERASHRDYPQHVHEYLDAAKKAIKKAKKAGY